MRKTLTLLVVSLLVLAPAGGTQADTDDLFVLSLRPNVLLLLDGSGSMNNTDGGIYSVSYPITYCDEWDDGECDGWVTINPADLDVDGVDSTRNDVALNVVLDLLDANKDGKVDSTDEDLLSVRLGLIYWTAAGSNPARRPGRSDNRPRDELEFDFPVIAPLGTPYADIKKAIIDPVIAGVPDIRIVVNVPRGCSATGSEDTSPCNAVSPAVGFKLDDTPIGDTLEYVEHYWWPETLSNDPDGVCRQNFIILITDGSYNGYAVPANVAASLFNSGTQKTHGLGVPENFKNRFGNIIPVPALNPEPSYFAKTFAVGFAGGDPVEVNAVAASGGTGTGFFPATFTELTNAVSSAIVKIQQESLSIAAPAVPTARSASGNALYISSFTPSDDAFWYGKMTAYPLKSDGSVQTNALGEITATPLWEAHTVLNTRASSRNLKTVTSGTTVQNFNAGMSNRAALDVTTDLNGDAIVDDADAKWLIDYVSGNNNTDPAWKLGDIYHSSPAVIGPPASAYVDLNLDRTLDTSFPLFRDTPKIKTRDRVLYVGSNGGMLHAFHAGKWTGTAYDLVTRGGEERWGFVPPNLLPKLQDMVSQHIPLVDGPPTAADVWLDGVSNDTSAAVADNVKAANEWHTVLVTGERRGGNAYFALDVTDPGSAASPNDPAYLWTFTDTNLGESWSRAAIGKVKLNLDSGATNCQDLEDQGLTSASCIERWVAFVGGGYDPGGAGSPVLTYQFTDKDSVTLTRDFTKQFAGGVTWVDIKLASDVPGASPPASCSADCFAYDPNGGPTDKIPAADLGYVGSLDSAIYGNGTKIENLTCFWIACTVGKALFVIDMNTGAKLWEYTVYDDFSMDRVPASPTTVDTDGDGFVDRVYVGDLSGNIWRFDLQEYGITSGPGTPVDPDPMIGKWTGSKLFTADSGQPFYDRLAVAADPVGQLYIYGGTGDLNDLLNDSSVDRFYAIQEHYPKATGTLPLPAAVPAVVTDADLADTTGLNTLNVNDPAFAGTVGWFLTLSAGEKILADPEVFAGVLLVASFTPTQATCTQKGGNTTLYALSYLTGGGASDYYAYKAGTDGLNKVAASYGGLSSGPQISLPGTTSTGALSGGDVVLFVCTSGEVCGNPPAPQPGSLRSIDYWRDL